MCFLIGTGSQVSDMTHGPLVLWPNGCKGNICSFDYFKWDLRDKLNFVEYAVLKKLIQERQAILQTLIKPSLPIIPATLAIFSTTKKVV